MSGVIAYLNCDLRNLKVLQKPACN